MYAFLGIIRTCITGETAKPAEPVNDKANGAYSADRAYNTHHLATQSGVPKGLFFLILSHFLQHIQSDFGRLTAGCIFFILNLNGEEKHMGILADKSCKPSVYFPTVHSSGPGFSE